MKWFYLHLQLTLKKMVPYLVSLIEIYLFGFVPFFFFNRVFLVIFNYFKVKNDPFRREVVWNCLKVCVASYHDPIEQAEIFQKASSIKCYTSTPKGRSGL